MIKHEQTIVGYIVNPWQKEQVPKWLETSDQWPLAVPELELGQVKK